MFYYINNKIPVNEYYEKVTKNDFVNKELLLRTLHKKSLTLRMTEYVYNSEFKYYSIFRMRNRFKLNSNTICYFD